MFKCGRTIKEKEEKVNKTGEGEEESKVSEYIFNKRRGLKKQGS